MDAILSPEVSLHVTETDACSTWTDTYVTYIGKRERREEETATIFCQEGKHTHGHRALCGTDRTKAIRNPPENHTHDKAQITRASSHAEVRERSSAPNAASRGFEPSRPHPAPCVRAGDEAAPCAFSSSFQSPRLHPVPSAGFGAPPAPSRQPRAAGAGTLLPEPDLCPSAGAGACSPCEYGHLHTSPQGTLFFCSKRMRFWAEEPRKQRGPGLGWSGSVAPAGAEPGAAQGPVAAAGQTSAGSPSRWG